MAKRSTRNPATPASAESAGGKRTTAAAQPSTAARRKSVAASKPAAARKQASPPAAPRTRKRRTGEERPVETPAPTSVAAETDDLESTAEPVFDDVERAAEPVFDEVPRDAIDPDLRHRMISEAAYLHYMERGYEDGYDLDDWLQAEAEIDRALAGPAAG